MVTKADVLNKHERTEDHKFAIASFANPQCNAVKDWENAMVNLNQKNREAIIAYAKIVYFEAKENLAALKTVALRDLCIDLGVDCLKALQVNRNTTYESYDSIRAIECSISECLKCDILKQLETSPWYSICIDESTDVSVTQSIIVYVKYINAGQLFTKFLKLKELTHATAAGIFEATMSVLREYNLDVEKMSAIGTDGAAVMLGERNGVAVKFKECNKSIISIHCVAHRLALASGQAADSISYLIKFQEILNKVYKYFQHSAKRTHALKEMQRVLDRAEKKFVQVIQDGLPFMDLLMLLFRTGHHLSGY